MARARLLPGRPKREPSRGERVVGLSLLAILAATVGLFALAGTGPGPAGLPEPRAPAATETFPLVSPGGWPRGEVERYDAETLFEKIDGKADAYLAYEVLGLEFASYARPDSPDRFVDLYLYDMGTPLLAFGIYRSERSGAEERIGIGDEACAPGGSVFVRKGRFYLQALPSDDSAAGEAEAVARTVADALPSGEPPAEEPAWFPPEGRVVLRYELVNGLMLDCLRDAYVAVYESGTRAFVARLSSTEEAEAALAEAAESFEFLGTPALLRVAGERVVGVVGAKDEALLAEILRRLEGER